VGHTEMGLMRLGGGGWGRAPATGRGRRAGAASSPCLGAIVFFEHLTEASV